MQEGGGMAIVSSFALVQGILAIMQWEQENYHADRSTWP